MIKQGLPRRRTARTASGPVIVATDGSPGKGVDENGVVDPATVLSWEEMQALFASTHAEEIVALLRVGDVELVRGSLSSPRAGPSSIR